MMGEPALLNLMKDPSTLKDLMNPSAEKIFEKCRNSQDFVVVISKVLDVDQETIKKDVDEHYRIKIICEAKDSNAGSSFNEKSNQSQEKPNKTVKKHAEAEEAFHKANDFFVNEDYDKALALYEDAINHDHQEAKYYLNRAACYLKTGDDVLVIEDCNHCLKLGFVSPRLYYLKTEAYKLMKNLEHARECNEEGLKVFSTDEKLLSQKNTLIN